MAHVLSLTDGTTTVLLAASGQNIIDYVPSPPDPNSPDVSESARIVFTDATSIDNVETTIRNVERLFSAASTWAESERGARVYVNFDPGTSGCTFRSQLLGGMVDLDKDYLGNSFLNRRVEATLHWTRVPYFEGPELFCASANLYNHSDADSGHVNYLDIAGSDIGGVVPCGCRIEITNTCASNTLGRTYVGVNAFKGTAMPSHILEGESASGMTSVANTVLSSGSYGKYQLSTSALQLAARWAISASEADKLGGHFYHVLLHAPASNTGIYAQLKVLYTGTTIVLAEAPEVLMNAFGIQDLGVIQLPPYLESETDYLAVDLALYVRASASGAWTYCDFIQLTGTDGWRVYERVAQTSIPQNGVLKDDSITGRCYVDGISTTQRATLNVATGEPILLYPNRDHRLYVLAMNADAVCDILRTFTVKVYARQRRLTL